MKHRTRSVRLRIVVAFGACMVLMVAIGAFGLFGLSRLNTDIQESYRDNLVPIADLSEARAAQHDLRLQLARLQIFHDPADRKSALNELQLSAQRLEKAWGHYFPAEVSSGAEREVAGNIAELLSKFRSATDEVVTALKADDDTASVAAIRKVIPAGNALSAALNRAASLKLAQAGQFVADSDSTFRTIFWLAIAAIALGCLAAAGVSFYLVRAISRPLARALEVAHHVADGRLGNTIGDWPQDEFGQLLTALEKMDRQLSAAVREIKANSDSVAMASQEIAGGNADLSARTEEQAASLEQTAASMEQLTQTVRLNSDNANDADGLAANASDLARLGDGAVRGMIDTIERISGHSNKISEITGLIDGIAFQTNILALNAAVEAARAGESGRGFAVVASEVRSLAQRSSAAAKEIRELIGASVASIRDSEKQATDAGATMGQVSAAIQRLSEIVAEIARASEEQSRGIEQVNQAIAQMDDATQRNAALVEEVAASASSLQDQARSLKGTVSVFHLATGIGATV